MNTFPKVSVIIPVYNTAEFLHQSLDSIVNQTLQNIEIICVDDGSTDKSMDILSEYAANDSRITILTQQNKGGGAARNTGMKVARGEYLAFFDSDDFFDLTLLEKSSAKADTTNADIVLFGAKSYDNETHQYSPLPWVFRIDLLPHSDPFSPADLPDSIFQIASVTPWSKIFRRSFIEKNKLAFQELNNSNDHFFSISAFSVAERISWIIGDFVTYRVNLKHSTQGKKNSYPLDFYKAYLASRYFLLSHNLYYKFESSFLQYVAGDMTQQFLSIELTSLPQYARLNMFTEFGLEIRRNCVVVPKQRQEIDLSTILTSGKLYVKFKPELTPQALVVCDARDTSVQPFISVIIPIYNVGDFLTECLDSVVNQTLQNIEIICVDDGSTDNSLEIAKQYAAIDDRFVVLHQANKGLGAARNAGLSYVRGKYIHFLDSDDSMALNAYDVLYKRAYAENLDVLRFSEELVYSDNYMKAQFSSWEKCNSLEVDIPCLDGEEFYTVLTKEAIGFASVCMAIYRTSYLNAISLKFIEGILHEDNPFTFKCTLQAKRIAYIAEKLYLRRVRAGSIMTTPHTYCNLYGYLVSYYDMCRFALTEAYRSETQKYIKIMLNGIAWYITSYSNEIPNVYEYCNEYELSVLQTFNLKTTPEYRIGRIITFIPIKTKQFVQYCCKYGIRYTIKRTLSFFKRHIF